MVNPTTPGRLVVRLVAESGEPGLAWPIDPERTAALGRMLQNFEPSNSAPRIDRLGHFLISDI